MNATLRQVLKNIIIFHGLADDQIDILCRYLQYRDYDSGVEICREGDIGSEFYVILDGIVGIYKHDDEGHEFELTKLKKEDCVGEMALIDMQKRSATIRTLEQTKVAVLTLSAIGKIYHENMKLYILIILNIAREFSRRLRLTGKKYVEVMHLISNEMIQNPVMEENLKK